MGKGRVKAGCEHACYRPLGEIVNYFNRATTISSYPPGMTDEAEKKEHW